MKRSRSEQSDQFPLGGSKGRIWSRFGFGATGAGLIPRRASQELPPGLGRDLGRGRRRLRFRMQRAPSIASHLSPGSLSGFPEDLIVMPARIILSSEIDVSGRCISSTLERSSAFFSEVKDRLVVASRGNGPWSSCKAIRIPMGRRDGPELPCAEMAHIEATIACSAEGRSLIVGPVLMRHTIGRKALPPAVAPCVKTAVDTGATELVLRANRESFQSDLIGAQLGPIAHSRQKNRKRAEWVGFFWARPIGSCQNGHG